MKRNLAFVLTGILVNSIVVVGSRAVAGTFRSSKSKITVIAPSSAGGKPDWNRVEVPVPWDYQANYPSQTGCASGEGKVLQVGPGKSYATLKSVPWLSLLPCDQVQIFYSTTPYRDMVFLGSRGEKNRYILIKGIPGPNGELPVLDGVDAVMPKDTGANQYVDSAGMIMIYKPTGAVATAAAYKPGYLHISGLKIQNVRSPNPVTNLAGVKTSWAEFSSGIYIATGEHIAITDCELSNNALGVFANSGGGEQQQTRDLLIARNYFHDSGVANKAGEHNSYTEAVGTIYEYNYFASPIDASAGDNIKDRSAGNIFRYNYIEGGCNLISLRDPESNGAYEGQQVDAYGERNVTLSFVYSNIFVASSCYQGSYIGQVIAVGDGDTGKSATQIRSGSLYFYNNRVVATGDYNEYHFASLTLFDLLNVQSGINGSSYTSIPVKVVGRNNLFYFRNKTAGAQLPPFAIFNWQGQADFQSNWINLFKNTALSAASTLFYVGSKFDGSGLSGLAAKSEDPGFIDPLVKNFRTKPNSPYAGLIAPLPDAVLKRNLTPKDEPTVTPFGK